MKKLITMVVIAAMAVMAQAAQVSWSATQISKSTIGDSTMDKYVAYLFSASVTDYDTIVAALSNGDITGLSANIGTKASTAKSTATTMMISGAKSNEMSGTGWSTGDMPSVFAIILDNSVVTDATSFMAIAPKTGTQAITGTGGYTVAFQSQASNSWQAMGVPEPTSALMLLVGLAGLALRRKQA